MRDRSPGGPEIWSHGVDPEVGAFRSGRGPTRREFVALGVGALLVAASPALLRRRPRLVRRQLPVMGTVADVAVVHRDEGWGQGAVQAALEELRRVESLLTWFRDDSEVGRANLRAGLKPVPVGDETARVLEEALRWARGTHGAFDPCLGRAVSLWDVGRRSEPPTDGERARWAGRDLWRALEMGRHQGRTVVRFLDPDVSLDLGGIAKGYGVDRAAEVLRAWGIRDGLVNVGGDLYALGTSEDGDPWRVGVRDPEDPSRLAATLRVEDEAVATSGDYEHFFAHQGRRYHHLLDPTSGEPRRSRSHSVTVVADSCMEADAAATAVFGSRPEEARRRVSAVGSDAEIVHRG